MHTLTLRLTPQQADWVDWAGSHMAQLGPSDLYDLGFSEAVATAFECDGQTVTIPIDEAWLDDLQYRLIVQVADMVDQDPEAHHAQAAAARRAFEIIIRAARSYLASVPECWRQTFTGVAFNLLQPTAEMVKIQDIAVSLSRINRFCGHSRFVVSVAYHSVLASQHVRGDDGEPPSIHRRLYALLHDAAEAYISDIPGPLKPHLPEFAEIEAGIEEVILDRFNCCPTMDDRAAVKAVDLRLLETERVQLMAPPPFPWSTSAGVAALPIELVAMPVTTARVLFANRLFALTSELANPPARYTHNPIPLP